MRGLDLEQVYHEVAEELGIKETHTLSTKVHMLVDAADEVLGEICEGADKIKIDNYDAVNSVLSNALPKPVWLELVHLRRVQRHDGATPEFIRDLKASTEGANYITALRSSFFEQLNKDEISLPTPDKASPELKFNDGGFDNPIFVKLLDESADLRHKLDAELWPMIRARYGAAFCFITGRSYADFKSLLDYQHYKNGGFPSENTPPRLWTILNKFRYAVELCEAYDFDFAQNWCKRLGISSEIRDLHPSWRTFGSSDADDFANYDMRVFTSETWEKWGQTLQDYGLEPYMHIVSKVDVAAAYVWDSRKIKKQFDWEHLEEHFSKAGFVGDVRKELTTTMFVDSFQKLDDSEVEVDEAFKPICHV